MKRIALILLICSVAQATNEIRAFAPGVTTAYAVVRETDGDFWYVSGQVFEAYGTGGRTIADYDIALTDKSGDMFVGDMDTNIGAGNYHIVTHYQAGGAPAETDPVVWTEFGNWTGTVWTGTLTPSAVASSVWGANVADYTGETTFGGEVGGIDPNLTLVLADTDDLQTWWTNGGRLDLLLDAVKAITDILPVVTTTVAASSTTSSFTLTAGKAAADAYEEHIIMVEDADDSNREIRFIQSWTAGRIVTVERAFSFTPAVGDAVWIMGTGYGGYLLDIWQERSGDSPVIDMRPSSRALSGGGGTGTLNAEDDDP